MILVGDALEQLKFLADDSVDCVITDPPYNVGKDYGEHDDRMPAGEYLTWLSGILGECRRVSKDGVIYFPGTSNVLTVPAVLAGSGLRFVRLLGWHKREFAGDKWNGGPAMSWEPVVWASKVDKPFFNRIFGAMGRDFLVVDATHGDPYAKQHPCPKPLPVMRWLVNLFCPEGGTVLDPFAGTGTTLAAAKELGRHFIGIELNPAYAKLIEKRLCGIPESLFLKREGGEAGA